MLPSTVLERLKIGHTEFGFGVLEAALDKIALTFAVRQGSEWCRVECVGQGVAYPSVFTLEQQSFFPNGVTAVDRPHRDAGKLNP